MHILSDKQFESIISAHRESRVDLALAQKQLAAAQSQLGAANARITELLDRTEKLLSEADLLNKRLSQDRKPRT